MLKKLDDMFNEETRLIEEMRALQEQYIKLKEDIDMLETMIMYASNRRG